MSACQEREREGVREREREAVSLMWSIEGVREREGQGWREEE